MDTSTLLSVKETATIILIESIDLISDNFRVSG